jgi:hypothetical protein
VAYTSKSGNKFTNAGMARKDDMRSASMASAAATEKQNMKANPSESRENDPSDQHETEQPSEVVAAHGPATQVLIKHEGGKHKVKSKHEDGHVHESEHNSAAEAHDAAKTLGGGDDAPEEDADMEPSAPSASPDASQSIPGLM